MGGKLKWPLTSAVAVTIVLLVISYVQGVYEMIGIEVWALIALAFGIWVGYKSVEGGGAYGKAFWNGIIIGVVWAVLIILAWGMIKGAGAQTMWSLAVFVFGLNVSGALVGAGYGLTK